MGYVFGYRPHGWPDDPSASIDNDVTTGNHPDIRPAGPFRAFPSSRLPAGYQEVSEQQAIDAFGKKALRNAIQSYADGTDASLHQDGWTE